MSLKSISTMTKTQNPSTKFLVSEYTKQQFRDICDDVVSGIRTENGVGTLQEKTIHAVLKNYYEPDYSKQEQKVAGFVADIFTGNEIIEIQTRGFYKLRRKLEAFLPLYPVTIVYPVTHLKWLRWVNEETGEVSKPRKSPKVGSALAIFSELYRIKMFLPNDNLRFHIVLLDVEEYRLLNGWSKDKKKGSTRNDGIPTELHDIITLNTLSDFAQMLPAELPDAFTSADLKQTLRCSKALAGVTLNILAHIGVIHRTGKKGNSIIYSR